MLISHSGQWSTASCKAFFIFIFFFFNDTATTEIYTLSLHDALPISGTRVDVLCLPDAPPGRIAVGTVHHVAFRRSEEHTSELQSPCNLVCRLLLEKKKNITIPPLLLTRISYTILEAATCSHPSR